MGIGPRKTPPAPFTFAFCPCNDEIIIKIIPRNIRAMPIGKRLFIADTYLNKHLNFFFVYITMKTWIGIVIFLFLMLLAPFSSARTKTVILDRGDSYVMENVNVTLIDYRKKDDKVLICVDNERAIISDEKRVGKIYFETRSFRDDGVKLTLDADCDDCIVSDNSKCFIAKNSTLTLSAEEIKDKEENTSDENIIEIIESNETSADKKPAGMGYNGIFKRLVTAFLEMFR